MEHPLALTQGGMVWRIHWSAFPQDFSPEELKSIQDGPEGNWFQFATHPRATDSFPGGLLAQQSWEGGISHRITQTDQTPTFSCSATIGQ